MTGFEAAAALITPREYQRQETIYKVDFVFWLCLAFFSITLWDIVLRLPMELRYVYLPEIKMLWQRKQKIPNLPPILLVLSRLDALVTIISAFFMQRQPASCQASLTTCLTGFAFGTACCLCIFTHRTTSIRRSDWPLQAFLWANVAGLTIIWHYWSSTVKISQ